jgi:hypothetical protein
MSLPGFYKQVERMAKNHALQTKTARAIVRKAGIRASVVEGTTFALSHPRTIVDAYINPISDDLSWQWLVSLEGYSEIRMITMSSQLRLYLLYAGVNSSALDPGDYAPLLNLNANDFDSEPHSSNNDLRWQVIPEELRVPMRLACSVKEDELTMDPELAFFDEWPEIDTYGFSLAVQAF